MKGSFSKIVSFDMGMKEFLISNKKFMLLMNSKLHTNSIPFNSIYNSLILKDFYLEEAL